MKQEVDTRARLVIIGVVIIALFAGLLTRLWFLQVAGGEKLAVAAQKQRDRTVDIPALRGAVLDAKGRVLAETVLQTSLVVDRAELTPTQREKLVDALSFFLGITPKEVNKRIDNPQYDPFEPVPVSMDLTKEQYFFVAENPTLFPHTDVTETPIRVYPNGPLGAHVLGYIGKVNKDELAARPGQGYANDDVIGKDGVELTYESELRGTPGVLKVEVDNRGQVTNEVTVKKPVPGHDVQLSLDLDAQAIAEESLQQGIEGARSLVSPDNGNYYDPKGGAVVVLDARTSQVVSIASAPTFDPNDFIGGDSDHYFDDPLSPLIDRALSPYAPGSTFKAFSSIAMLKYGIRTVEETFYDSGCFEFGNEGDERCNARDAEYGYVDLPRALTVSSDVYFYNVGNEFWNIYNRSPERGGEGGDEAEAHPVGYGMQDTARTFGFDEATGIELPGDQPGRIPDLAFNKAINENSTDPFSRTWRRGDSASLAVGQGDVLVTPLQLANAYAAIGNGGKLHTPQLLKSILETRAGKPAGELGAVVRSTTPLDKADTMLDPGIRDAVLSGLHGVVHSGEGTAYAAFRTYEGLPTVVGKTGTAQNTGKNDTSWFAAITNPDNDPNLPQYAVVAMVEEGGFGADVAAPIVRRVIDFLNGEPTPPPVDVKPFNPNGEKQD
jgi:penicillin-binding protein 2